MKKLLLFIFIIILSSCNLIKQKEATVKYREKDPCETLKISSSFSDIEIEGWKENFIEINSRKIIYSGVSQDLNLIDTFFERNNNELTIKTRIPSRIEGRNNLKIYVPFILSKLYMDSENGNIICNKYLGDIDITNKNGNINVVFEGNILRIDSFQSRTNLYIKSYNSTDIVLNCEEGNTKVNIESLNSPSYIDVKSLRNDILINLSNNIDHKLSIKNVGKKININYNLYEKNSFEGYYYSLSGKKGRNYNNLSLDISNEEGQIIINSTSSNILKKELQNMFK